MNASDPACLDAHKRPQGAAHVSLLVVGAGAAGAAAAIAAAKLGIDTQLIDEHPVPGELMALDVPLHFGQRMARSSSNARSMEHILETSAELAEAYDLGIDVQLGVCAWGVFPAAPGSAASPLLVGLADAGRSWYVSCDRLIVASGARDLCIGFPGWEKPGVMGAQAALQLIRRYDAFTGSRMLILGGGALAVEVLEAARQKGVTVAAVVDVETPPEADEPAARIRDTGVPHYTGHLIEAARGSRAVESAVIVGLNEECRPRAGSRLTLGCDTIVLAIGTVPNIELLDVLDVRLDFAPSRGGWIPRCGPDGATSIPSVYAAGDCAGLGGATAEEGRCAAHAAATSLGRAASRTPHAVRARTADASVPRARTWMRAQLAVSGLDVPVCQCEEVSRRELIGLRPPRYLGTCEPQSVARDLRALGIDGPLNQDQVKRLTRAGMGPCQGRRCREQIQILLETAGDAKPGTIPLARYRPPVRPLPVAVLAADEEAAALRDHWVAWFNISTQWLAHWEPKPVPLPAPGQTPLVGESE